MAQHYDNMAKYLTANYGDDISQFVLGVPDCEVLEHLDTEQQVIVGQRTDTVTRIRVDGREAILHIEFQTHNSQEPMWARNAAYHGHELRKHRLQVFFNVIYLHPASGHEDPGFYAYQWNGYEYLLRYKVIRLIEIEGEAILARQAPRLLPFTPLMKPPAGMPAERWAEECVQATLAAPVDQKTKDDLLYGIYLFGGIVYSRELLRRLIPEELMQESATYRYLVEKHTRDAFLESTLALLEAKFHPDDVGALRPVLLKISDIQRLKQLNRAAGTAQNVEAFSELLHEE